MKHAERALELSASGSSCSQSVFAAFAPDFGMDEELAHRIAAGMGGGFGRKQYLCGAISGAALVLGLAYGNSDGADAAAKDATYSRVHAFISEMEAEFGASDCRALLQGNDTNTPAGREAVKRDGLTLKVCRPLIARAAEKLEALLATEIPGKGNSGS